MRRAAKTDSNHEEVVRAFRKFGCSVHSTAALGGGFPDLVVAKNFKTALVEVKDGSKVPSARKLTKDEQDFHDNWQGLVVIVENLSDVIATVKGLER